MVSFSLIDSSADVHNPSTKWKLFRNCDGAVTTLRRHLEQEHGPSWSEVCRIKNLFAPRRSHGRRSSSPRSREPFTRERFLELLLRWVAVDDQVGFLLDSYTYS